MKFVWDSPLCADSLSSPSSLAFWVQFSSFGEFLVRRRPTVDFVVWWTLWNDTYAYSLVQTPWNHEFSRIDDFVFLRKPQSSLIFPQFPSIREYFGWDLLGICSRDIYEASSKFHRIWTAFAQDLSFEALVSDCLEGTGLTGLWNRSGFLNSSPTGLIGLC